MSLIVIKALNKAAGKSVSKNSSCGDSCYGDRKETGFDRFLEDFSDFMEIFVIEAFLVALALGVTAAIVAAVSEIFGLSIGGVVSVVVHCIGTVVLTVLMHLPVLL